MGRHGETWGDMGRGTGEVEGGQRRLSLPQRRGEGCARAVAQAGEGQVQRCPGRQEQRPRGVGSTQRRAVGGGPVVMVWEQTGAPVREELEARARPSAAAPESRSGQCSSWRDLREWLRGSAAASVVVAAAVSREQPSSSSSSEAFSWGAGGAKKRPKRAQPRGGPRRPARGGRRRPRRASTRRRRRSGVRRSGPSPRSRQAGASGGAVVTRGGPTRPSSCSSQRASPPALEQRFESDR